MSITKITLETTTLSLSIEPNEADRAVKLSLEESDKIGTVLIEDLARSALPPLLTSFLSTTNPEVECKVTSDGEVVLAGETFDLPIWIVQDEDGHIDILRRRSIYSGKK